MEAGLAAVRNLVWGAPMLVLILGCGAVCTAQLRFVQFRRLPQALRAGLSGESLSATATALGATVGTGNIAGVAGALAIGGPGAVFWMELAAALGMAVKYAEIALAVRHCGRDSRGRTTGGPMYYLPPPLGRIYALFGMLTAFGVGNLTQSSAIGASAATLCARLIPTLPGRAAAAAAGVFTAVLCAGTYLGGARRVGRLAELLVPPMALGYLAAAGAVIWVNRAALPAVLGAIFAGAFSPRAAWGGAAGLTFRDALSTGLARGVFSNEAGLGSAAIAHGASSGADPVREGLLGIFEVFADTTVICTVTALAVLTGTSVPYGQAAGAELVTAAFAGVFGSGAPAVTAVGMALFALTTVLTWGFYGAECAAFLLGRQAVRPYLACFCVLAAVGAAAEPSAVWTLAEILNGLTAAPNLLALPALIRREAGELLPPALCGKLRPIRTHRRPAQPADKRSKT